MHESTNLQKSDLTGRWTKFLKTTRSYMLFESIQREGCWLCCYKEDSEQTQSRILNIAFPDHSLVSQQVQLTFHHSHVAET